MTDALVVLHDKTIAKALRDADPVVLAEIAIAVQRWQLARIAELARYPAQNPLSRYIRTGTLGRTWASARPTWQASKSGFESRIGNATPYGPFVQGERQSRRISGWRTAQSIATAAQGELEQGVAAAVSIAESKINGAI